MLMLVTQDILGPKAANPNTPLYKYSLPCTNIIIQQPFAGLRKELSDLEKRPKNKK